MRIGLSIIIPTWNEEKVLFRTLQQFLPYRSSFPLEIIVSDDSSTDQTVPIARRDADRVLRNETGRRGRAGALNRGARAARYPNLLFLDADMQIDPLPAFLEELSESFIARPEVCGGMIDFRVAPGSETAADRITHEIWNCVMRGVLALTRIGISTPGFQMAKRWAFERISGFDEGLPLTQDVDFSLRLSRVGGIHYFTHARLLESPRRYRDEGYLVYVYRSSLRWASLLLLKRSHGVYKPVR